LTLEQGNGLQNRAPHNAKKFLKAYESGVAQLPESFMDTFLKLWEKVKQLLGFPSEEPYTAALTTLNDTRGKFVHFDLNGWSIERAYIIEKAQQCVPVLNRLLGSDRAFLWHEDGHEARTAAALHRLMSLLDTMTSQVQIDPRFGGSDNRSTD
jgi:hypothetical protein